MVRGARNKGHRQRHSTDKRDDREWQHQRDRSRISGTQEAAQGPAILPSGQPVHPLNLPPIQSAGNPGNNMNSRNSSQATRRHYQVIGATQLSHRQLGPVSQVSLRTRGCETRMCLLAHLKPSKR